MGSWSGRHVRRFGLRGQAGGLGSWRLEAGEWDCCKPSCMAANERVDICDDI